MAINGKQPCPVNLVGMMPVASGNGSPAIVKIPSGVLADIIHPCSMVRDVLVSGALRGVLVIVSPGCDLLPQHLLPPQSGCLGWPYAVAAARMGTG